MVGPIGLDRTPADPSVVTDRYPLRDSDIPVSISGPATTALCRLLNAITIAFRPRFPPHAKDALGRVGPGWFGIPPPVPIVGVFSSTLLPGFIGPESSVLPADLPPSATSPPWDLLRGSALCRLRQPSTTGQEGFPG